MRFDMENGLKRDEEIELIATWLAERLVDYDKASENKCDFNKPFKIDINLIYDGKQSELTQNIYNYKK